MTLRELTDKLTESEPVRIRKQAEYLTHDYPKISEKISPEDAVKLIHELQVYEIELKLQLEELRKTQEALEESNTRYFDLYNLSPIGYCTVSESGLIKDANLTSSTIFGAEKHKLVLLPFSNFIAKECMDTYYLRKKALLETKLPQSYNLTMVKADGTRFLAHINKYLVEFHEIVIATTMLEDTNG
jgi:PAS domain S-box-containing protein